MVLIPDNKLIHKLPSNNHLIPNEFKKVAKGMEEQFSKIMIEQMQKASGQEEPDSTAMNYYKSLLDDQYSQLWSRQNEGEGLQQLILDQIYPREKRTMENLEMYKRAMQQNTFAKNQRNLEKVDPSSKMSGITMKKDGPHE